MEAMIYNLYSGYDWNEDFEGFPEDINDVIFLIKCKYRYEEYPRK